MLAQLEDYVDYTVQFPGGRRFKNAMDKIAELLSTMLDRDKDTFRDQIVRVLQKASAVNLLEIVRYLYRKSDFRDCAVLGEQVSRQISGLPQFLTAKCLHLGGDYRKARDLFDAYLSTYPASDEAGEARLRLVLLNYRLGQDANVISIIEKYMRGVKNDHYDLWMRYWYVRSLQRTKSAQANVQANRLIADYPVSYYGLLLGSDLRGTAGLKPDDVFAPALIPTNVPEVHAAAAASDVAQKPSTEVITSPPEEAPADAPPVLPPAKALGGEVAMSKTMLTPLAAERWRRFRKLAGGGWTEEATREADELLLFIPSDNWLTWAQVLSANKIYSSAIRLSSQLFDREPSLRSFSLLSETFPRAYEKEVVRSSEKVKISPYLTWSLMRQESAFQRTVVSTSNAIGLMQLLGSTGEEVAHDQRRANFEPGDDLFDTSTNIQIGTAYLARILRQNDHSVPWALASYNSGPTKVEQYLRARKLSFADASKNDELLLLVDEFPVYETSFYVKAILRNVLIYKLIDQKKVQATPDDWRSLIKND